MRETSSRGWHRWRVTVTKTAPAPFDHAARRSEGIATLPAPVSAGAGAEGRGPDGIRHELVARVRQQIADGTYDTEEKWLAAEEALLRRFCG